MPRTCSPRAPTRSARLNRAGSGTWTPLTRGGRAAGRPAAGTAAARRVRPLGVDRYGVRLRVESDDGDRDIRLPFRMPVDDVTGLGQAIRVLMGCPFVNGLRARQD